MRSRGRFFFLFFCCFLLLTNLLSGIGASEYNGIAKCGMTSRNNGNREFKRIFHGCLCMRSPKNGMKNVLTQIHGIVLQVVINLSFICVLRSKKYLKIRDEFETECV